MGLLSRALKSSQRGEQRDHEAKKVNAASAHKITANMVAEGAVTNAFGAVANNSAAWRVAVDNTHAVSWRWSVAAVGYDFSVHWTLY